MNKIEIICEIGINANGDIEIAKKLIDIAVSNNIDYVKFQKRDIETCYSKEELDKPRESPWGTTTREQKQGLEFSQDDYDEIDWYCNKNNIKWFTSVWDIPSVDFMCDYCIPYIKIPSAMITHKELLKYISEKNFPVIMSTGMSTKKEVDVALNILGKKVEILLHTTSIYPAKLNEINLKKIVTLKKEYGKKYKIGYSNHSPSVMAVMIAAGLGAEVIEFHITLDRSMYGTDQSAAIEKRGVEMISDWLKDFPEAMGDGKWKIFDKELEVMKKLRKYS